jgi:hypothetical protein
LLVLETVKGRGGDKRVDDLPNMVGRKVMT